MKIEKDAYSVKAIENLIKLALQDYSNVTIQKSESYDLLVLEIKDTGQTFSIVVQEE